MGNKENEKALLALFMMVSIAVLAACGNSQDSGSKSKDGDLWASVKKKGVLTVGTEGTYEPFTFHDKRLTN